MERNKDTSGESSRLDTDAYKAQVEISKVLYDPSINIFKPWQFESCVSSAVTLKTTYEELKILWNEDARFRKGFAVKEDSIIIPNLFAKLSGIHSDLCEYEKNVKFFLSSNKIFFSPGPLFADKHSESTYVWYSRDGFLSPAASSSLAHFISKNGALDMEKLISSHFFESITPHERLQKTMVQKLKQLLESGFLLKPPCEDTTLRILHMLLSLDKNILGLLENYDYPFEVPKIVLFIGKGSFITFEDCAAISFLCCCGLDILLLTPSGHTDIEKYINSLYFDTHILQERNCEMDYDDLKGNCNTLTKRVISRMAAFFLK